MGTLYDMRSRVEHMHDYEHDASQTERERRLFVMRMSALVEAIARYCLRHFLLNRQIWPHYVTRDALTKFWRLPADERRAIWRPPADIATLERDFDASRLTDEMLQLS